MHIPQIQANYFPITNIKKGAESKPQNIDRGGTQPPVKYHQIPVTHRYGANIHFVTLTEQSRILTTKNIWR